MEPFDTHLNQKSDKISVWSLKNFYKVNDLDVQALCTHAEKLSEIKIF